MVRQLSDWNLPAVFCWLIHAVARHYKILMHQQLYKHKLIVPDQRAVK